MKIGVISDTHSDKAGALPFIMKELKKIGVGAIIHCGDIEAKHLNPDLFLGLPVICALNAEQLDKPAFEKAPEGWNFTIPDDRIRDILGTRMYIGHKRAYRFLRGSENAFTENLEDFHKDHDGVRWFFSGHTHAQLFIQTRIINFLNPGAIDLTLDGFEFAIIDTESSEIIFSRIPKTKSQIKRFSVGVISDSLRISEMDSEFWKRLADEFEKRKVKSIIHCGNIVMDDIGRPELENFNVFYNLRPEQRNRKTLNLANWHEIGEDNPIVEINGYRFYVQLDLGADLLKQSADDMHSLCLDLRRRFGDLSYVLCGFTNAALLVEEEQSKILNPGDVFKDRNFAIIELPRNKIIFGHVPSPPLSEEMIDESDEGE